MLTARGLDFTENRPDLAPADILIRRAILLLYAVGIVASQIAAHIGSLEVVSIRLFELLGLSSIAAMALTWRLSGKHLDTWLLTVTSVTGTLLTALGVALSGGSESPLWLYYLFPVIFNAFLFRNRVVWTLLPIIVLVSVLPAWIDQHTEQLLTQLFIVAPVYISVTLCLQALVMGLGQVSKRLVLEADTQARLDEYERWNSQLESVHLVAQEITRLTSVDELADAFIEHTESVIPFHSARVYIRQEEKLLPIAFRGSPEYSFQSCGTLDLNVGEGLTGWVAQHATSLNIDDVHRDPRAVVIPESSVTQESMLLSPLIQDERAIGVVVLVRIGICQFSDRELKLLDIIAGQASNAVSKAWNLDAAHRQARTDDLTGLLNHRAMSEQLESHLERAMIHRYPVSIAMLDADRFKHVNDCHGHPTGDKVLKSIASMLMSYIRTTDVAVRYGGDEFMLILPDTDAFTATQVTQRIISLIAAQHVLLGEQDRQAINIHLSRGMSTFPDDGSTVDELLEVADSRLYAAKARYQPFAAPISDLEYGASYS